MHREAYAMWMTRTVSLRWLVLPALLAVALVTFAACKTGGDADKTPAAGGETPTVETTADDGAPADGEATADDGAPDGATDGAGDGATNGDAGDGAGDGGAPANGEDDGGGNGGGAPSGGGTVVQMVSGRQFSPAQLLIAAGKSVTITAKNTDPGIPHSFALYNSEQDASGGANPIAETATCSGPCEGEVNVNLDGGVYFFRCEVHGNSMSGTLTAR
jgi:plastocyanin